MAKKLWGGRFKKETDPLVEEFTRSVQYDHKLAEYDVIGSMAHIKVLKKAGFLTAAEYGKLNSALGSVFKSIKSGAFKPDPKHEDIHSQIQDAVMKKCGDAGLKLHTARSRNDQVILATKMYCIVESLKVAAAINGLQGALEGLSAKYKESVIPGFTHMQHAQPVYLKDFLGAYKNMLGRDLLRIEDCLGVLTMGAGALAGTPIPAQKYKVSGKEFSKYLGPAAKLFDIEGPDNSLDSVSDRDQAIQLLSSLAIIGMHLSRLAEDLIIWSTKEFGFVEIDDAFCTGSSLMPQKKNPDSLELIRGYAGRLNGNLVSVLTMMKGLPLTYNRDMQLDKEPLFNSFEVVSCELKVMTGLIKTLKFNEEKIKEHLKDESLYATDLAYYLVDKKIPFKTAHNIIGRLVKFSIDNDISIKDMPEDLLKGFSDKFVKKEIVKLFDPLVSVRSKRSINR